MRFCRWEGVAGLGGRRCIPEVAYECGLWAGIRLRTMSLYCHTVHIGSVRLVSVQSQDTARAAVYSSCCTARTANAPTRNDVPTSIGQTLMAARGEPETHRALVHPRGFIKGTSRPRNGGR